MSSFDILHFHANTASYVEPVLEALRADVRVVVHSHGSGAASSLLTRACISGTNASCRGDRITKVACPREAGRWMFGAEPFEVIHNGIDVEVLRVPLHTSARLPGTRLASIPNPS